MDGSSRELLGDCSTLSPEVRDYIRRWCVYYVTTENYDRSGVHGVDPNHPEPRFQDAMPAPWRSASCTRFAAQRMKRLLHASNSKEAAAREEAKQLVQGWEWARMEHEAGIELLPLHQGPLATHPDFNPRECFE